MLKLGGHYLLGLKGYTNKVLFLTCFMLPALLPIPLRRLGFWCVATLFKKKGWKLRKTIARIKKSKALLAQHDGALREQLNEAGL